MHGGDAWVSYTSAQLFGEHELRLARFGCVL